MEPERNVTPMPGLTGDSWSSDPAKAPAGRSLKWSRGRSVVLVGLVALVTAGVAFGTFRVGVARGDAAGHERGTEEGYASGHDDGFAEGRTDGFASGRLAGYEDGKADGYSTGYNAGKKTGYSDGYRDGSAGSYGRGWTDGCLAVFSAIGDDTAAAWSDVDGLFDSSFASTVSRWSCY